VFRARDLTGCTRLDDVQRVAVLLIAVSCLRCTTINVQAPPQRYSTGPAATLLLPYFEADPFRYDTSLTITNTAASESLIRFTFWTDHGFPIVWFTDSIAARTTRLWSISGILNGQYVIGGRDGHPPCAEAMFPDLPGCAGSRIGAPLLGDTGCLLRGSAAFPCAMRVSERHSHWIGYLTADVVSSNSTIAPNEREYYKLMLSDNVLTGTFEQRVDGTVLASGPLVHLAARSGLPSTFYANFSHGDDHREPLPAAATVALPGRGETELHIWTEPAPASYRCEDFTRSVITSRRITPWRRQMTIRAGHQTWVTVGKPTPPDPNAPPPPERCETIVL
jgi:hypothetical protein